MYIHTYTQRVAVAPEAVHDPEAEEQAHHGPVNKDNDNENNDNNDNS